MVDRRGFLKVTGAAMAGMAIMPRRDRRPGPAFPEFERLGRVCVGKVDLQARPDPGSPTVGALYEDAVVAWLREKVGVHPNRINQTWVETPDGFIYAPYLQPVRNEPNTPIDFLPETSLGPGIWAEVTVPWVELQLDNPPPRSPWLQAASVPRFYYSQVVWVDRIRQDADGRTWYRLNERYGFGDIFWAPAEALKPLQPEELSPIRPGAEGKRVVVSLNDQTLTCFEAEREVYFCRVSTGYRWTYDGKPLQEPSTPTGRFPTWRKLVSTHMVGGTTGAGYDVPGIAWTVLFTSNGVAVHSTFWHNDFGVPRSHGCVNAKPEDARWIFRWMEPVVPYDPGDVTVSMPGGTQVQVSED